MKSFHTELRGSIGGQEVTGRRDPGSRGDGDHQPRPLGTQLRQHRPRDIDRPEQGALDLRTERLRIQLLEEPRVETTGIVDQDVEVPEHVHRGAHRSLGGSRIGHIQSHCQQVIVLTQRIGDALDPSGGGNHRMASRQSRLGDVDPQAPTRSGDQPYLLIRHLRPLLAPHRSRRSGSPFR